ncbi:hypothetical protein DJ93_4607 [Bacillus clarus]|uniref:Uncharacterized protein n=1 Tax=Bacillus clarus TaxID=2338372 RepID=A0A090YK81_9BACI|nr:hypothetical protein DJ93_4607 [Bacillus clarus]
MDYNTKYIILTTTSIFTLHLKVLPKLVERCEGSTGYEILLNNLFDCVVETVIDI